MNINERVSQYGMVVLNDEELLSVLVKESKIPGLLAQYELAGSYSNGQSDVLKIVTASTEELERRGLTRLEALRLSAAVELGLRVSLAGGFHGEEKQKCSNADQVYRYLAPRLRRLQTEVFGALLMDSKNYIISSKVLFRGGVAMCQVDTAQVFRYAVLHNANKVILFHNHPSGDPFPSNEDRTLTSLMVAAGKVMGVHVVDHIVLGESYCYSFAEEEGI